VGFPAKLHELRARLIAGLWLAEYRVRLGENLIAPQNKRVRLLIRNFPGFHLGQRVGDIARRGHFRCEAFPDRIFIKPRGHDSMSHTRLEQQPGSNFGGRGQNEVTMHVDNRLKETCIFVRILLFKKYFLFKPGMNSKVLVMLQACHARWGQDKSVSGHACERNV
jgi:hypothetical protein